ncbi:MAG: hypothetical protein M1820_010406 [Bogoriella megaspora]|nr:MAG: hypothetical protein M1820_010406 [Bogoriella megaspora]
MTEIITTTSVSGAVGVTLNNATELFLFIESTQKVPREIQSLGHDMHALEKALHAIRACIQDGIIRDIASGILRESLVSCVSNIKTLHSLLRRFRCRREWNSAFMWRMSRNEIGRLRDNIGYSKQTLCLSLAIAQVHALETGNRRLSQKIGSAIRPTRLESMLLSDDWSISNNLQISSIDGESSLVHVRSPEIELAASIEVMELSGDGLELWSRSSEARRALHMRSNVAEAIFEMPA